MPHSKLSAESSADGGWSRSVPGKEHLEAPTIWMQEAETTEICVLVEDSYSSQRCFPSLREKCREGKLLQIRGLDVEQKIWVGLFRQKNWEQNQSSVKHPRVDVASAVCSYSPQREKEFAGQKGRDPCPLRPDSVHLGIHHSPVLCLCHTTAPFPNLCCSQGLWMHFLLPINSVWPSEIKLILCQGMRDWKDAFMNHVKLIWSRSHLKACKLVPSRWFELFVRPNRWLKRSFRQDIVEGTIFGTLFPVTLTQFQSVRLRIQIQKFSFKKGNPDADTDV